MDLNASVLAKMLEDETHEEAGALLSMIRMQEDDERVLNKEAVVVAPIDPKMVNETAPVAAKLLASCSCEEKMPVGVPREL